VVEPREDNGDEQEGGEPDELGAPAPLGAPEPIVAGAATRRRGGGGWRPRAPRSWLWLVAVPVVLIGLALMPTLVSGLKKTPRDRVGISYGGGPFEGVHFQRVVQPGSNLFFNGFFDNLYLYPSDQVNYIVPQQPVGPTTTTTTQAGQQQGQGGQQAQGGQQGQGTQPAPDAVVAPTRDRVQVSYQVAVYFKLNTDELRAFHEQLGLRYKAYTTDGWNSLIRDTFRQQIENALQEETRKVDVADLFGNADLLVQLQDSVQTKLTQRLEDALGQQFFCAPTFRPDGDCGDPTFVIKRVDIPTSVTKAFEDVRTSEIQIQTKENEVRQREAEARAIAALGLSGQEYDILKAIESGKITFWVLDGQGGITITGPDTGTGTSPTPPTPSPTTTTTTTTTAPSGGGGG
jgi:regulator of protease activity HflC (stomatin/prohibitin superfamily)